MGFLEGIVPLVPDSLLFAMSDESKPKPNYGFLKGKVGPIDDSLLFAMTDDQAERFISGEDW
jgi:hypothetical protein